MNWYIYIHILILIWLNWWLIWISILGDPQAIRYFRDQNLVERHYIGQTPMSAWACTSSPKCFQIYANRLWKTLVDIEGVWYGIRSEPQEFCHHPKVWSKSASSLSSIIIYIRSSWKLRLNWKLQTPAQNCGKCGYQGNSKFNKLMEESNAENLCNFLVVP